jgi:hypothetical protein
LRNDSFCGPEAVSVQAPTAFLFHLEQAWCRKNATPKNIFEEWRFEHPLCINTFVRFLQTRKYTSLDHGKFG